MATQTPSGTKSASTDPRPPHHHVYVVLLRPTAQEEAAGKAHVYVGMTGLTPEQRFANHLAGHKSARIVHDRGIRLMPELYDHLPAMHYQDAAMAEIQTASDLRKAGFVVTMFPEVVNPILQSVQQAAEDYTAGTA